MTDDTEVHSISKSELDNIARTLGAGPMGLAHYRPESWARAHFCFMNALAKAEQAGGAVVYGWTFHSRQVAAIPGPGYLFVTHHAVWHAPDLSLVDVTPHPDPKHRPLGPDENNILFLVDARACPVITGNQMAPLPQRYFARNDDSRLFAYVEDMNQKEDEACRAIYAKGATLTD